MKTVMYVNHGHGERCGVWNYGDRHFKSLHDDENYTFKMANVISLEDFTAQYKAIVPDIVIFNYSPIVMGWAGAELANFRIPKIGMLHNYEQSTIAGIATDFNGRGMFSSVAVLDPTITPPDGRVFALSRPITDYTPSGIKFSPTDENIQIGSFGFALHHKQFPLLMREVNRCFENATLNLHMTEGRFAAGYTQSILDACHAEITKPGITLNHTSEYLSEEEVVDKLAQNHINALFYNWPSTDSGLSSSTDFMIASQRPMLLSTCAMFKHVQNGSARFPEISFPDILGDFANCEIEAANLYERTRGQLDAETKSMLDKV